MAKDYHTKCPASQHFRRRVEYQLLSLNRPHRIALCEDILQVGHDRQRQEQHARDHDCWDEDGETHAAAADAGSGGFALALPEFVGFAQGVGTLARAHADEVGRL